MEKINEKLFKGIYELYNIDTDDVFGVVVADNEYQALPNGRKCETANDFFEQERTIKELREELEFGDLELTDVLKSIDELFYMVFDKEEYEIKDILEKPSRYSQYVVIDKVQGYQITFDISDDYNIFNLVASGIFFANMFTTKHWWQFLDLLDQVHNLIFNYKHPEFDDE